MKSKLTIPMFFIALCNISFLQDVCLGLGVWINWPDLQLPLINQFPEKKIKPHPTIFLMFHSDIQCKIKKVFLQRIPISYPWMWLVQSVATLTSNIWSSISVLYKCTKSYSNRKLIMILFFDISQPCPTVRVREQAGSHNCIHRSKQSISFSI